MTLPGQPSPGGHSQRHRLGLLWLLWYQSLWKSFPVSLTKFRTDSLSKALEKNDPTKFIQLLSFSLSCFWCMSLLQVVYQCVTCNIEFILQRLGWFWPQAGHLGWWCTIQWHYAWMQQYTEWKVYISGILHRKSTLGYSCAHERWSKTYNTFYLTFIK